MGYRESECGVLVMGFWVSGYAFCEVWPVSKSEISSKGSCEMRTISMVSTSSPSQYRNPVFE